MSDAFLPGNGFDTYETQDKVLVSMDGTIDCGVAVRILQQQGFGVAGAVVQLAADQSAWAAAARQAAEALGIECIVLKAEALADQPAEVLGSGNDARFAALLTAADKLGIQYIATGPPRRCSVGLRGCAHGRPRGGCCTGRKRRTGGAAAGHPCPAAAALRRVYRRRRAGDGTGF